MVTSSTEWNVKIGSLLTIEATEIDENFMLIYCTAVFQCHAHEANLMRYSKLPSFKAYTEAQEELYAP